MHTPRASIVIAVLNESETITLVAEELVRKSAARHDLEIVFVDDGSTDDTPRQLETLCARHPGRVRLVRHDVCCGKSQALRTGIAASRGEWIATMDGDGQNDPDDALNLLQQAWADGGDVLVAGCRVNRADTTSKRLGSRLANRIRHGLLKDDCPDTGCGLKAFRRESFRQLPGFEGMHRFLPALFQLYGHKTLCVPVHDRARIGGQSKYTNLGRALVGIRDMLGVIWLRSRTRLPGQVSEFQPAAAHGAIADADSDAS